MKGEQGMHRVWIKGAIGVALGCAVISGCALLESEEAAKGRKLYNHYCMHCHGESGQQQEGFNWGRMPDPRPRDLSESSAMSTFSDQEIFNTISREMRDTSLQEVLDDENYFAVPTMPTFKYTLSEKEVWAIVGHVRTLHGGSLEFDVEGRGAQLESEFNAAKAEYDQAKKVMEEAVAKKEAEDAAKAEAAEAAAIAAGKDPDDIEEDYDEYEDEILLPEEEAFEVAEEKFEKAKAAFEGFSKRPKMAQIRRPDLTVSDDGERAKLEEEGKHLYSKKYGCHGCHSIGDEGGLVGPALDRAGFRLNDTWVYRWIRYPQGMKKHTRMPNLGFDDHDARAVTAYLETLRAPKPENPIPLPE
ncbi:c-type cytochrome [Candidatus Nitronereus thalassa]|uniref:C-type cytochrome n=1 Tax=Candidatus Nitronereus thalassa TaxID=3020898 RepID=A0ABU3KAR1_9BACT|nr:c-type cytochrome [Candidatus Nitronereus thalassa]MDT7043565.1 c-type cytochrome [Candidatus Nitronereus thalassa]